MTLAELADKLGVSPERVRQIEVRAFEKVRRRSRTASRAQERVAHVG